MERIETTILRNLVFNEEYSRKVIPFIQKTYFDQRTESIIFEEITQFIVKYSTVITPEALSIETENRTDLSETEEERFVKSLVVSVMHQWNLSGCLTLLEKWWPDRAIYLALMESIGIVDGQDEKKNRDAIPSILSDASVVSLIIILDTIIFRITKRDMSHIIE